MPDRTVLPLSGRAVDVPGGAAGVLASRLVTVLGGTPVASGSDVATPTPLADWAASGAMALTGRPDGPPLAAPGAPASAVRAALAVVQAVRSSRYLPDVGVLGERAALAGLVRRGPWSPGGTFRALRAADGWLGLSLPRESDIELIPALIEDNPGPDPWAAVTAWAVEQPVVAAVDRAAMLGLACALVPSGPGPDDEQLAHRRRLAGSGSTTVLVTRGGPRAFRRERPRVVDLTSLWAGPLCAYILGLVGADVVKVESTHRPDGARRGPAAFFDLLHAGHASVALDLTSTAGRDELRRLISTADVVLEASRPRALAQLGIDAADVVAQGTTWTSITAYGRSGPWANRVGFGDDVAAAAGLVVTDAGEVLPCGDALADPLAGLYAAAATAAALTSDHAFLLDVAMRDVVLDAMVHAEHEPHTVRRTGDDSWVVETDDGARYPVALPRARRATGRARTLGADNDRVRAQWLAP